MLKNKQQEESIHHRSNWKIQRVQSVTKGSHFIYNHVMFKLYTHSIERVFLTPIGFEFSIIHTSLFGQKRRGRRWTEASQPHLLKRYLKLYPITACTRSNAKDLSNNLSDDVEHCLYSHHLSNLLLRWLVLHHLRHYQHLHSHQEQCSC